MGAGMPHISKKKIVCAENEEIKLSLKDIAEGEAKKPNVHYIKNAKAEVKGKSIKITAGTQTISTLSFILNLSFTGRYKYNI